LAGREFRRQVGTSPPPEQAESEEELEEWHRQRIRRVGELAAAFSAGALGDAGWSTSTSDLQLEIQRRALTWHLAELNRRAGDRSGSSSGSSVSSNATRTTEEEAE
jgi:hypothetical protein